MALCEICIRIDFNSLRFQKDTLKYELDNFSSVVRRSRYCRFCKFLIANWGQEILAKRKDDPDYVQLSIESSTCGSVPIPEDGSAGRAEINTALIRATQCSSFPLIGLDFCVLPAPTVRDYVSSGSLYLDDSRQTYSRRFVSRAIDIRLAKKWHQLCQEKHGEACEHPQWLGIDEYPTNLRIIDVTTMSLTTAPRMCRYVALSYVWGKPSELQVFQTSKSTVQAFSQPRGLRLENLPKTIADTVHLVQEIGERYLWIDSLCIVQDDDYDKASYISQMDLIYACSIYTIVAAVGEDCQARLPGLCRRTRTPKQQFVQVSPDLGLIFQKVDGFNRSRWSHRGWTYQELQLSRRALIFYEDKMIWNCECDYWVEDMCLEPSTLDSAPCFNKTGISLGFCTPVPRFDLHTLGYHIFHYNVQRDFTNEGDAFDAFRGILNRIQRVTGIEFYWGLPCEHFHHALLWREDYLCGWREDLRRLSRCRIFNANGTSHSTRIPSWSWLGWYTHWYLYLYPGDKPKDLGGFFEPRNTDWAAKWFRIDLDGRVSEIATHSQDLHHSWLSSHPYWAGAPIASDVSPADVRRDYGRIVAHTSFNRLRIRTQLLDIYSRKEGTVPRDGKYFDLLGKNFKTIGELYANDLICTAKKWDKEEALELEANGAVHDFIVISRERHAPVHGFGYKLNLMLIEWNSKDPGVASRRSLFQINEKLWTGSNPQWRKVILE